MFEQSFSLYVSNDLKQPVEPIENEASDVKQEMNDRIKVNLEETHESTTWV